MRTFRIQSPLKCYTLPLPEGSVERRNHRQVFWLAIHPPGAFPVFRPVTYCPLSSLTAAGPRGNIQLNELHPSSLSSPFGHRNSNIKLLSYQDRICDKIINTLLYSRSRTGFPYLQQHHLLLFVIFMNNCDINRIKQALMLKLKGSTK